MMKNQMLLFFAFYFSLFGELNGLVGGLRPAVGGDEVGVGLIADMGSKEGKIIQSCLSMAISDFYGLHRDYQMRIVLHTRDSKGDPLLALSAAFKLSEDNKVKVILSAQKSTLEAKFLAEFGDHTKIPVISIQGFIDFMSSIDKLEMVNFITQMVNVMNFNNFKLTSSNFEILNVPARGRHLLSSSTIDESSPRGRMMQTSSKTLRIAVPTTNGFPQLLKVDHDPHTNTAIFSGFCIDAFKIAMAGLNYQVFYQFVPFEYNNPNIGEAYDDLIYQVYLQNYDAVVGDMTITANRSSYVDFTLPYTDMGVGMVTRLTPKDSQNLWIFLKPLTPGLWLTMVGVYVVTALVIWLIERPAFVEQQTQQSNGRIGRMFGFSFSILVFAHWEKLSSNLSRSVVVLWVFVVFILGSNYTATLTSMMTVRQIEYNSKMSNIGHRLGPVTQEVVGNLNFDNSSSTSVWLTSPEEYANALSEGAKNGGVSAIIDEMPYISIFLEKYPTRYSMVGSVMPTTNGFGFVFPKGSALARDISREIAKLREDGRLQALQNAWFQTPIIDFDSEDTTNSVNSLTVGDFRGLFLISGAFLAIACILFLASLLYKNFHVMKKWILKLYICKKIFKNRRDANIIHPEFDN
ncbi:hypothetical protein ES319_D07G100400v1 [Gossypium barbadense]|uniref:Ionotropic glutamate receptor C-terminal domain-containing protein n=2 Tax=Gossypium TaxID=3633 RepID=A0A5J5QSB4_GOSBA|nr:hypothetical protein ES319_D07G100400v1 [Gossypium barbadense]PPD79253.1 hypothetical protein GOBAR_DD23831 [Gossypium barbadense]TYG60908.1 hypothetical protein ES288_D07G105200v1 [Gossypium darwinii]